MRSFKLLSSASLILLCSASSAMAMDVHSYAQEKPSGMVHTVGWDQKNLQVQTQGTVYLRAQIEELQKQNEQLRNTVSQLRHKQDNGRIAPPPPGTEYDTRLQALIEENKRLNKQINNKHAASQYKASANAELFAQEIHNLKLENKNLQKQIVKLSSINNSGASDYLKQELETYKKENESLRQALINKKALNQGGNDEVIALENRVSSLQKENRDLALALAEATNQALEYKQKASSIKTGSNIAQVNPQEVQKLQSKIKSVSAQNTKLQNELETLKKASKNQKYDNAEVLALKKQNQSLRATIKAQSQTLIATSNASQTAERMISENLLLKKKLEQADKSSEFNGQTAKQLFEDNQELRKKVNSFERVLASIEDEKAQLQEQLQNAKAELTQAQLYNQQNNRKTEKMGAGDVNNALQQALEKERETTIAYRTKIREYQDEIESLKNKDVNKEYLEEIEKLTKENKSLKEDIDDLSKKLSAKKNSAVFAKMDKIRDDVTYVDAPYPEVESVLPLLDEDGNRIDYETGVKEIVTEDLLSQGPKPLSD